MTLPSYSKIIGSLSNDVYERRTSTGSGLFSFLDDGFDQSFSQIAAIRVKKLSNTNFISSRHIKREKSSLPVDVHHSKTSLLKLPNALSLDIMSLLKVRFFHFLYLGIVDQTPETIISKLQISQRT